MCDSQRVVSSHTNDPHPNPHRFVHWLPAVAGPDAHVRGRRVGADFGIEDQAGTAQHRGYISRRCLERVEVCVCMFLLSICGAFVPRIAPTAYDESTACVPPRCVLQHPRKLSGTRIEKMHDLFGSRTQAHRALKDKRTQGLERQKEQASIKTKIEEKDNI